MRIFIRGHEQVNLGNCNLSPLTIGIIANVLRYLKTAGVPFDVHVCKKKYIEIILPLNLNTSAKVWGSGDYVYIVLPPIEKSLMLLDVLRRLIMFDRCLEQKTISYRDVIRENSALTGISIDLYNIARLVKACPESGRNLVNILLSGLSKINKVLTDIASLVLDSYLKFI